MEKSIVCPFLTNGVLMVANTCTNMDKIVIQLFHGSAHTRTQIKLGGVQW